MTQWAQPLRSHMLKLPPCGRQFLLLPVVQDVEHSVPSAASCLHAAMLLTMTIMD